MSQTPDDPMAIVGEAVLVDYPLRLWARQQEHSDEVLREFTLLLTGERSGTTESAPRKLVDLAQMFSDRFGGLIDAANSVRQVQYDAGADRMDWHVPMPKVLPSMLHQVDSVLAEVDEYCRTGSLLALARPAEVVALQTWVTRELLAQYDGASPTPWPGPW